MHPPQRLHRRHAIAITLAAFAVPLCATAVDKVFKVGTATSNITPPLVNETLKTFNPNAAIQPESASAKPEPQAVRCAGGLYLKHTQPPADEPPGARICGRWHGSIAAFGFNDFLLAPATTEAKK